MVPLETGLLFFSQVAVPVLKERMCFSFMRRHTGKKSCDETFPLCLDREFKDVPISYLRARSHSQVLKCIMARRKLAFQFILVGQMNRDTVPLSSSCCNCKEIACTAAFFDIIKTTL